MVEIQSSFFVGFAIIFVILLGVIIYGSRGSSQEKPVKSREKKKAAKKDKVVTEKKVSTKKRTASKKEERTNEPPKRYVVDNSSDTRELLEFLKGKDKKEIARTLAQEEKKTSKQKGKPLTNDEEQQPVRAISEKEAAAFQAVKVKPKKEKVEGEQQEQNAENSGDQPERKKGSRPFLKVEQEAKEKKKKEWEERKAARERGEVPEGEDGERKPRERRPRRERQEGEGTEGGDGGNGENEQRERRPRRQRQAEDGNGEEGEQRERKPRGPKIPSFDEVNRAVKYEAADIGDILSSIGASYKPSVTVTTTRYPSVFSKIQRGLMLRKILAYLSAADLCHLAAVNNFFSSAVKIDTLWQALYVRDFGKKEKAPQHKTWRNAYRAAVRGQRSESRRANKKAPQADKAEVTEQEEE